MMETPSGGELGELAPSEEAGGLMGWQAAAAMAMMVDGAYAKDRKWEQLKPAERKDAQLLGYQRPAWNAALPPAWWWEDLSEPQQEAARFLGHTRESYEVISRKRP